MPSISWVFLICRRICFSLDLYYGKISGVTIRLLKFAKLTSILCIFLPSGPTLQAFCYLGKAETRSRSYKGHQANQLARLDLQCLFGGGSAFMESPTISSMPGAESQASVQSFVYHTMIFNWLCGFVCFWDLTYCPYPSFSSNAFIILLLPVLFFFYSAAIFSKWLLNFVFAVAPQPRNLPVEGWPWSPLHQ